MKINPDCVSSIAALIAIIFAIIEALFKFQGQKSEKNILFYSKYHYICQQMEISVYSIKSFVENCKEFADKEICGYALAHMVADDFENVVYNFEELAYICFKGNNVQAVKKAQEFGALALSLSETVNSFYQSIINESYIDMNSVAVKKRLNEINSKLYDKLNELKDIKTDDNCIFDNNDCLNYLIKQVINKNKTLGKMLHFVYIAGSIGLILFCTILLIYSLKS